MKALFLDLASNHQYLALTDGKTVHASIRTLDHKEENVMGKIQELLAQAGWTLEDLTNIACVVGPGGFMSIRVGVATANALAWSLKIPLAGVGQSEVWLARMTKSQIPNPKEDPNPQSPIPNPFVWLHSTKKELLFIRGFGELEQKWPEPTLITLEEARAQIPAGVSCIGELIPEHREALQLPEAQVKPMEEVFPELIAGLKYSKEQLLPWYGREA